MSTDPTTTDEQDRAVYLEQARALGTADGTTAGEAFEIRDAEHAAGLIAVIDSDDCDPELVDLPHSPLSGEWADGRSPAWLYRTLGVEADYDSDDAELCRAYEQGFEDAVFRVVLRRARPIADPAMLNRNHTYHKLNVTLHDTSNPYLKPRLPLRGELEVYEMTVTSDISPGGAVFRALGEDGRLGAPAEVRDIVFTYTAPRTSPRTVAGEPLRYDWQATEHAAGGVKGFLRWLLPTVIPYQDPRIMEELREATRNFTDVELGITVNGIPVDAGRFLRGVDENMDLAVNAQARRVLDEVGRFDELRRVLDDVGSAARLAVERTLDRAGFEMPVSRDDWD